MRTPAINPETKRAMRVALWVSGALSPLLFGALVARVPWIAEIMAIVGGVVGTTLLKIAGIVVIRARMAHTPLSGLMSLVVQELGHETVDTGRDAIVQTLPAAPATIVVVAAAIVVVAAVAQLLHTRAGRDLAC
jgi:hypothetical protein